MRKIPLGRLEISIPDNPELIRLRTEAMMIKNDLFDLGLELKQLKEEIAELRRAQHPPKTEDQKTSNWVEEAAKEAIASLGLIGLEPLVEKAILSHAPVIDAEKLAEKIDSYYFEANTKPYDDIGDKPTDVEIRGFVAQLITDATASQQKDV